MTYYEAYRFLKKHPRGEFWNNLEIALVMVDPVTHRIHQVREKNTSVQVWLETGPVDGTHDIRIDSGGNSFEEAVIKLAALVKKYYGS